STRRHATCSPIRCVCEARRTLAGECARQGSKEVPGVFDRQAPSLDRLSILNRYLRAGLFEIPWFVYSGSRRCGGRSQARGLLAAMSSPYRVGQPWIDAPTWAQAYVSTSEPTL